MSQENVEIVKAAAAALREGGPWADFATPDYTWDMSTAPGMWPEAQVYRGRRTSSGSSGSGHRRLTTGPTRSRRRLTAVSR
jgi:hypothetical protein